MVQNRKRAHQRHIPKKIDKIFEEQGVRENILNMLNLTLFLVDKEVGQHSHNKRLFIKRKKNY